MLDTDLLSLRKADLDLYRALDFRKQGLVLVTENISCVGVSLSYVEPALCTRLGQQELSHKYTW